ncbi:hypothetical protein GCM10010377_80050 [Streptomyces viridiviolaceus]|nr:hypothetical protein GCM10010377_80050 [Streptomyces viridiviolaceus]
MFGEQRREHDSWQDDVGGDAIGHGEQAGDQADERDRDGSAAQRAGDAGGQADTAGGAPGQPAQGQALRGSGRWGEDSDLQRLAGGGGGHAAAGALDEGPVGEGLGHGAGGSRRR